MKSQQKTLVLGVVALLLLGLNMVDSGSAERLSDTLPTLSAVPREDARRIELSNALNKVVLQAIDEESSLGNMRIWQIAAPIEGDADQIAVRTLLNQFRKDVPLDVKVDAGNPEAYGLDAGNGLVVEIFTDGSEPEVSFTIGKDAPGGSSFVRLSGDDSIYRARVGGRHRFERDPADWRNRVLMGFDEPMATAVQVRRGDIVSLGLTRLPPEPSLDGGVAGTGSWSLDPDPGWPTDQTVAIEMLKSLGGMRAGEIMGKDFQGGFEPPLGVITVSLEDGSSRGIEIGSRSAFDGAAFVRREGRPEVYKVSSAPILRALQTPADLRERTLFALNRIDIDTMTYEEGRLRVLLQQDLATRFWRVIEPQNIDVDMRPVFYMVNTFAELRADAVADGVTPAEAGLDQPSAMVTARMISGREHRLRIGRSFLTDQGLRRWYVGSDDTDEVYELTDAQVEKLKQGFGRS